MLDPVSKCTQFPISRSPLYDSAVAGNDDGNKAKQKDQAHREAATTSAIRVPLKTDHYLAVYSLVEVRSDQHLQSNLVSNEVTR